MSCEAVCPQVGTPSQDPALVEVSALHRIPLDLRLLPLRRRDRKELRVPKCPMRQHVAPELRAHSADVPTLLLASASKITRPSGSVGNDVDSLSFVGI